MAAELQIAYAHLQTRDHRWAAPWPEIELVINPNGPLINGGSDGDNGQTGRKLAVDYYGPRAPIGGGALSGKDLPTSTGRLPMPCARPQYMLCAAAQKNARSPVCGRPT